MILLALPIVQTGIAKYVTQSLNNEFNTNINIDCIHLTFGGNVKLNGIYVEDYKKDTLFYINGLSTSIVSFRKAIDGKLAFGKINMQGLVFNLKTYKGENHTNLDVFVEKLEAGDTTASKDPFLLTSSKIALNDGRFRLIDENLDTPKILDFYELNSEILDFKIHGPNVTTHIEELAFMAKNNQRVENLEADFSYSKTKMSFDNLTIKTPLSQLNGHLVFTYDRKDFADFLNKVKVQAVFDNSIVNFSEINRFYNEFGENEAATFKTSISGYLNNMTASGLEMISENSHIKGNFNFKNLFTSSNPFSLHANIGNISSNYQSLKSLLPNLLGKNLPSSLEKLGQFNINGTAYITENSIDGQLNLRTEIGYAYTDLLLTDIGDIDNASYKGYLSFEDFDIGNFINDPTLGKVSLAAEVDGIGFTRKTLNTKIDGTVYDLEYNKYRYKDLDVSGILQNQLFNGVLVTNDQNLQMNFTGLADFSNANNRFDFKAEVIYADLNKLNFVKRDAISIFKGEIEFNIEGNTLDDMAGEINFENTNYINQNDSYFFDDFQVTSVFKDSLRVIEINSPDIITGYVKGNFKVKEVGKVLENSIGSIYTNYSPHKVSKGQVLDFDFKIYNKIVDVFFPEIEFGKNTFIRGKIVADEGDFKLTFKSPTINAKGTIFDNIQLQVDNKNPLFNTYMEVSRIKNKYYDIEEFNLINATIKDTLFFRTEFKGGEKFDDSYNLNFYHTFNDKQQSVIGLKTSDVSFKGNTWMLNEEGNTQNRVIFNRSVDSVLVENITMSHKNERINLKGVFADSTFKDIELSFKQVSLNKITPAIDSLQLNGIVDGELSIFQRNSNYFPSSNLVIKDFNINAYDLGDLEVGIIGNENLTSYLVNVQFINDQLESFRMMGDLTFDEKKQAILNLDATLRNFNLSPFSPLGEDVISKIRGYVTGDARITGPLSNPSVNGLLTLNQAGLTIPYLNVDVALGESSRINLLNQTFEFDNIQLTDTKYKTRASLNGMMTHNNFTDWFMDLELDTRNSRFLVLDTEESDDELYYGTGFVNGQATLSGPVDALTISVDGATGAGTSLKIPISDVATIGDDSFITFVDKHAEKDNDGRVLQDIKGLELNFELSVTPDAEVEIVLDKKSGSTLKGSGEGILLMEINTKGKFNMWGDFVTYSGEYNFKYGGLIDKRFKVLPGGSISWEGDPLTASLSNMEAVYSLNANPALLLENPQYNKKIETEVVIHLEGQLMQPETVFDIRFPDTNPVVASELNYRLED